MLNLSIVKVKLLLEYLPANRVLYKNIEIKRSMVPIFRNY